MVSGACKAASSLRDARGLGGGGGSRTRVRNRSQQRDSMLSRVPEGFALRA
jgi:hypothetical protein